MNLKKIILSTIAVVSLASASDVKVSDYKLMEKEYEKVLGNGSYLMDYYKGQNKNFIRIADANRRAITNMVHYTSDNSFAMFMEGAGMFFDGGKNPVELSINPEFKKTIDELVSFKVGSGAENIYIVTDPECPYCKKYEASLKPLKELESSYTINYIFLPLESLGHNKARSMSQYFMLADDPKVSHERMNKVMVRNDLTEYKDFMYKINSLKKKEKLESEDKSLLEKWESAGERIRKGEKFLSVLGVRGTPTIINSNMRVIDSRSQERTMIDKKLQKQATFAELEKASVAVTGNLKGNEHYFVFSSITCPHCKTFEKSLSDEFLEKNAISYFFFGNPQDPTYSWVMSGKDKKEVAKRIHEVMTKGVKKNNFKPNAVERNLVNSRINQMRSVLNKLSIKGTPTVLNSKIKDIDLRSFYQLQK